MIGGGVPVEKPMLREYRLQSLSDNARFRKCTGVPMSFSAFMVAGLDLDMRYNKLI